MDLSRFLQAARQGCVDPFGVSRYWKDSPSPPPAPDYTGAAQATAAGNLDAAKYATAANRVSQFSPYGSEVYSQANPGSDLDPQWSKQINLSPVGQQLLDYANNSSLGLGAQTGQALNRVDQSLSQPFSLGGANDAVNKAYGNITSRLDPQWQNRQTQLETQLTNQGLRPGGEAWDNAMRDFNFGRNDAYTQANTQAMNFAPQTMQLDLAARSQPLNELNALRTGSQVTNPQFGQVPQQAQTAGPNYSGAAASQGQYDQGLYNAQVGQNNAMMGGLFSLGGAALGASGMPWWIPK